MFARVGHGGVFAWSYGVTDRSVAVALNPEFARRR
jgi:hypothetical protein